MPGWHRWLWLSLAVVVLDFVTKQVVLASFRPGEVLPVLPVFSLVLAFNPGAAFSFLAGASGWQRWVFTGIAVVASVVIVWLLRRGGSRLYCAGLALILGGALGNLWDRITIGQVVDFLLFHWREWSYPAFNVADSAITVGAALLIIDSFRARRTDPEGELMDVVLASPRGFCAGVDRAIAIVEQALAQYGAPIYVRHEVVHNRYVVDDLRAKGAIFVEELDEVPAGATVIFSAHGVSKAVQAEAAARGLKVFDATCPLVTKVHVEIAKMHEAGREIVMIGHAGHPEVEGTMGQCEGGVYLVESVADVERLSVRDPAMLAYVTQTTLSVDDAAAIVEALKRRFPAIVGPKKDDICYATQNRQDAVKLMAPQVDVVIVVGSPNSSNSNRLREVAANLGVPSYMVDRASELDPAWVANAKTGRRHRRRLGAGDPGARSDRAAARARRGEREEPRRRRREGGVPDAQGSRLGTQGAGDRGTRARAPGELARDRARPLRTCEAGPNAPTRAARRTSLPRSRQRPTPPARGVPLSVKPRTMPSAT